MNVRAIDGAENVDDTPATYRWNVDSTGPTPSISSPTGTVGPRPSLAFTSEPGATYTCHIDGGATVACSSGSALSAQLGGSHVIYVKGTDGFGNVGSETSQSFIVDDVPPTFTSLGLPDDDGISDPAFDATYTLSDGSVTACKLDGSSLSTCRTPIKISGLLVGQHTLQLTATDALGNSASVTRTWVVPPVSMNQPADNVLGQMGDFTTNVANKGGVSTGSFSNALGVSTNGSQLIVADEQNCRALYWPELPTLGDGAASYVIGQTQPGSNTCPTFPLPPADAMSIGSAGSWICSLPNLFFLSDATHNRVLRFSVPVGAYDPSATLVLGEPDFMAIGTGIGADQLNGPLGMWCDASRLVSADAGNHRVLIWNGLPTANGEAADIELGWPSFADTSPQAVGPSSSSLNVPFGVHFGGGKLFVSDTFNNRVLVWNALPTASGQAADFVLGQPDFTSSGATIGPASLNRPYAAVVYKNSLFVVDRGNRRILVWTPLPTRTGEAAHAVLGADGLNSPPPSTGDRSALFAPHDMTIGGGRLFVSDGNRVVTFTLRN